ncbi:zinc finger BED domain-containing protein RICESLEEPER 2-like [Castanea sativa]|uniref:zinc finger BED domain-containing protein RICESLEEPER 2-like n=1 Tax=Castanea sativa TaxID=21020 RepID=UPI003F64CD0B
MKYLKGSESRMCKFDECVKIVGTKRTKGLRLDVCTRWNATYDMIDSTMRYRSMLNHLAEEDVNFKHCPSRDEWNRVERITRFFKPFNDITTLFFGTGYLIANLYFQGVSQIQMLLLEEMESQDSCISNMAKQIKACVIVLGPRYKLDYVDFIFKKIKPIEHIAEMKVESIETTLYKLS